MAKWMRSLRWRLQAWHAAILLLVIVSFGGLLHWEITRSQWDAVDDELVTAARVIEGALRFIPQPLLDSVAQDIGLPSGPRFPPPRGDPNRRANDRGPRQKGDPELTGNGDAIRPRPRIDWGQPPKRTMPESPEEWESMVRLPDAFPQQLGDGGPTYYAVWNSDGKLMKRSVDALSLEVPPDVARHRIGRDRFVPIRRGAFREVYVIGPHSSIICVGRSVVQVQERITARQTTLVVAGLATFGLGLLGGWWMSRRATDSLNAMSETAASIGADNLSKRVDVGGFDQELERLGSVFNQMLNRLEQSFEQQKQFTSDASHELRTPLAALLTTTELALARDREPDEYRRHLEANLQSTQRMQRLVQSLLTLARLDNTDETLAISNVDLSTVIATSIRNCNATANSAGVSMECNVPSVLVRGNEVGLEQVFNNLIDNAIRYNRSGGQVRIRMLERKDQLIEIAVEDDGVGIAADQLSKIFNRFYRIDPSRSQNRQGCGLGLSIAKQILERHNGSIRVESVEGQGSVFTVTLPNVENANPQADVTPSESR